MLKPYHNISIIYGNSGRECAQRIAEKLTKEHKESMFPIRSYILADEIMDSGTILDKIKDIISRSTICIIILTFDDVNNTRVRQNVLVEMGMAASWLERENCFYITEKYPLPDDFPSDFKSSINPNLFDKNNLDEIVDKIWKMMQSRLALDSNMRVLEKDQLDYDFRQVLKDVPSYILEEPVEAQLDDILDVWYEHMKEYDFTAERIVYLAERIVFLPIMKNNNHFFQVTKEIESLLRPGKMDGVFQNQEFLRTACELIRTVLEYSVTKVDPEVLAAYRESAETAGSKKMQYQRTFEHYAASLKKIIRKLEEHPEWNCSELLKIIAYDYAALASMKASAYSDQYSISTLKKVIECYEKVCELSEVYFDADELWKGYAYYNMARAYEHIYELTGDESVVADFENAVQEAIYYRSQWKEDTFRGAFGTALSYEYFLACSYDYRMRYQLKAYTHDTLPEISSGLKELRSDLSKYCENIDVGRLFDLRGSIDELIYRIEESMLTGR